MIESVPKIEYPLVHSAARVDYVGQVVNRNNYVIEGVPSYGAERT